jgi:hypothetical protein
MKSVSITWAGILLFAGLACTDREQVFIPTSLVQEYAERFNRADEELYQTFIPNHASAAFLAGNIPRFECPDKELEEIYYFRWWTFRKHIRQTPEGFIISEFLPPVGWAGKYNGISCAAMHHYNEGRWLRHADVYLDSYARYWLRGGGGLRDYSFPVAHALYNYFLVTGSDSLLPEFLPDLVANYEAWEKEHQDPNGLFWQRGDRDGMELSAASAILQRDDHYRSTIQSYLFADAHALSLIARRAGKPEIAERFRRKAEDIRQLLHTKLWDTEAGFYKVAPRVDDPGQPLSPVSVRELHGYTPWYIEALQPPAAYAVAWKQLIDPRGFDAPFGLTTTEQRSPYFRISYEGHECQWNGPSWPFSTSVVLTALAHWLNREEEEPYITKTDYLNCLKRYAHAHHLTREDGAVVPWIDENLNPYTGDWIARTRLKTWENETWSDSKGGMERGKDYNHSTFCDLIITGLIGIHPREGDCLTIRPLLPPDTWDYFCLEDVPYQGHFLTVLYDKDGTKYRQGTGLRIYVDGRLQGQSPGIAEHTIPLTCKKHNF